MHIRVGTNVLRYSVLVYSSTYFGVLRYTLYSCTLGMMYSVLVLEYIHKVLVPGARTFRVHFSVLFHKQCYYFDIDDISILQLLNMMCTIIYQDHASCFFSPIQVYELSGLIVCSSNIDPDIQ